MTEKIIQSKKDLHFWISEDRKRNNANFPYWKYRAKLFIGNENAIVRHYLYVLRHCEYHYNNKGKWNKFLYIIFKIRLCRLGRKYNLQIPINKTGYGLRMMHLAGGGGVLLNICRCGIYCGFNSGVLIGNKDDEDARPTIGDYTSFGPEAKAFGKITIGSNVFVAANAVVTKNIPDNCICGGIPAKIIKEKQPKLSNNAI